MTQRYHNPFVSSELVYPAGQQEDYQSYAQRGSNSSGIDQSPFPRMVDLWWAGLSLAAHRGQSPVDLTGKSVVHMIDGDILDRDSWRVQFIMLIAMSVTDAVEVVTDPARMISIANGLAAAGVPQVIDMLTEGQQPPVWNLSEALESLLTGQG